MTVIYTKSSNSSLKKETDQLAKISSSDIVDIMKN